MVIGEVDREDNDPSSRRADQARPCGAPLAVTLPAPLGAVPAVKEASKNVVRQVRKLLEHG